MSMRQRRRTGLALCLAFACAGAHAADAPPSTSAGERELSPAALRAQEIAECRSGEIATWNDGHDRPAIAASLTFAYRDAGAPAWFAPADVSRMLAQAARAWSQCGVGAQAVAWRSELEGRRDVIRVEWSEPGSGGNFGLADLGRRTLSLGAQAFALLRQRNPAYDARQTLQMVIAHEMGHVFGVMAHSRRCVDVMSYYDDGRGQRCFSRAPDYPAGFVEYRSSLPTACDIARCRAANPPTPP